MMERIMEISAFLIVGMAALLPIRDCYTSPGKGGYPVSSNGYYFTCNERTGNILPANGLNCRDLCTSLKAGHGYCYGFIISHCYCEGLTLYGGYPVDNKGQYYTCIRMGMDKHCEYVCNVHGAGYGYCYGGITRYCYCERLTDENQHRTYRN